VRLSRKLTCRHHSILFLRLAGGGGGGMGKVRVTLASRASLGREMGVLGWQGL